MQVTSQLQRNILLYHAGYKSYKGYQSTTAQYILYHVGYKSYKPMTAQYISVPRVISQLQHNKFLYHVGYNGYKSTTAQ